VARCCAGCSARFASPWIRGQRAGAVLVHHALRHGVHSGMGMTLSLQVLRRLTSIWQVRPRELWFALGTAFLATGAVLSALAVGYYAKEQHYSLSSSPHMIGAYIAFTLAAVFFALAVAGWGPWLRWQRFPNVAVLTRAVRHDAAVSLGPGSMRIPTKLLSLHVFFINRYADRNVCVRAAYLRAKTRPGSPWGYWQVFSAPSQPLEYHNPVQPLELPLNLAPRTGAGGYLVFELPPYLAAELQPGGEFAVEVIEALSGKMAQFPATLGGEWTLGRGLVPTTQAERVTGPPPPAVYTRGSPWETFPPPQRRPRRPRS
jgi:hypothetical protein